MGESDEVVGTQDARAGAPWKLLAVSVLVLASIALASIAWSDRPASETTESGTAGTQTHQLSVDQAVCLRFGLTIRRSEAQQLTLKLGKYATLDPEAAIRLRDEIDAIDQIATLFPAADYRIVKSMAESADASARALTLADIEELRDAVAWRSQAISETARVCSELADFDLGSLDVGSTP